MLSVWDATELECVVCPTGPAACSGSCEETGAAVSLQRLATTSVDSSPVELGAAATGVVVLEELADLEVFDELPFCEVPVAALLLLRLWDPVL